MNAPAYRALRFDLPLPSTEKEQPPAGLLLRGDGRIETVDGEASVRQAILMLLSTRPGERLMRPSYGCDLSQLVFSVNDDTTAGLAAHYVRRAIEAWEPRVEIIDLVAARDPEAPEQLEVYISYRVKATRRRADLGFRVLLQGGLP
jgi:phage baseplate assembly protein W